MSNNLILETKIFNLSTRGSGGNILNDDRDYKSYIEYNIPDMIVRDESIEYIQFSVPYAVIPVSFYTINQNNNQLNILENGISKIFVFPQGNYNASTFITQFKTLLGSQWNLTLNIFNSIFTITNSVNSFTFYKTSTLTSIIGFSIDLTSSLVNSVNTLVLTRCCNFLPLPRVCIRCSELLTNNNMIGNNNKASDLVISIPNNAKPNGQIYYQNQTQVKSLYKGNNLNRIVFSLTDDDGNFINFNGVSSFFVLQFDIFRQFVPKLPSFSNIVNMVNSKTIHYPDEEIMQT
jgi:hypothetical protein